MQIELKDENYCAHIVRLGKTYPLSGLNNLAGSTILNCQVLVQRGYEENCLGVFFPIECEISEIFLSTYNLFRDKSLNVDKTKQGFFEQAGRVKAIKFMGHKSEGFFLPIGFLTNYFQLPEEEFKEGMKFNVIDEVLLCQKYIPKNLAFYKNADGGKQGKLSKILSGQFYFHTRTTNLKYAEDSDIANFDKSWYGTVTEKIHGTSVVIGKLLVKRPMSFWEKVQSFFGKNIFNYEYDLVWASQTVLKGAGNFSNNKQGYYKEDVWGYWAKKLEPYLLKGMTVYGEIVGYTPSGKWIQREYDYGCKVGESKLFIYRITEVTPDGEVVEHDPIDYFNVFSLFSAENVYLVPFHEGFSPKTLTSGEYISYLKNKYLYEENCSLCKNQVPREGVVFTLYGNSGKRKSYKLKTFNFLQRETKNLDKCEIDIETTGEENG
jgi:RNA ligase